MKTEFSLLNKSLYLRRYPEHLQHSSWQAWDSADEYVIEHIESLESDFKDKNLLIFNDESGALATWFSQQGNTWKNVDWVNDSYVAHQSCSANLEANECDANKVNLLDSLSDIPHRPDVVIIKIPKTSALLHHQLIQLQKMVSAETVIIAAGKTKSIHKSTLALFEKYLGETKTSLAKKKSRLVFTTATGDKQDPDSYPTQWYLNELSINNHANVFSRHQLDIGGRFLIENLPDCKDKTVVDLGCGNGIVGLSALNHFENCKVVFTDESYMAVASAKLNVKNNFPELLEKCEFLVTNCLDNYPVDEFGSPDIVLCNPPFHQQHGITDHIATQMFEDSYKLLNSGGELRVIGNRHLDYHHRMKNLFGSYAVIASNKKFSILSAVKL